jgi:hypothetical protein
MFYRTFYRTGKMAQGSRIPFRIVHISAVVMI